MSVFGNLNRAISSVVARPILVVGSKPTKGERINKNIHVYRYVAIIAEVQSGGNLCVAAHSVFS